MTTIEYTDHSLVVATQITQSPTYGRTMSGYGGRIPTDRMIQYRTMTGNRWHRVFAMVYGNSGSLYIRSGGRVLFLDTDTEYSLSK